MSFSEKLTFQNAPSPQEFNEGDDADIICDVMSSPPPTIIWKFKKTRIQPETDGTVPQPDLFQSFSFNSSMPRSYFCSTHLLPYFSTIFPVKIIPSFG